jgi:hypothetical protein
MDARTASGGDLSPRTDAVGEGAKMARLGAPDVAGACRSALAGRRGQRRCEPLTCRNVFGAAR